MRSLVIGYRMAESIRFTKANLLRQGLSKKALVKSYPQVWVRELGGWRGGW